MSGFTEAQLPTMRHSDQGIALDRQLQVFSRWRNRYGPASKSGHPQVIGHRHLLAGRVRISRPEYPGRADHYTGKRRIKLGRR